MPRLAARIVMARNLAISPRASSAIEARTTTIFRSLGGGCSVAPELKPRKEVQNRNSAKEAQDLRRLTAAYCITAATKCALPKDLKPHAPQLTEKESKPHAEIADSAWKRVSTFRITRRWGCDFGRGVIPFVLRGGWYTILTRKDK